MPSSTKSANDTLVTVASGGTLDWDDKIGVNAADGALASITSASFDLNVISFLARASGFVFSIPTNATIVGVEVMVRKNRSAGTSAVDQTIQLLNASSVLIGTNKADTTTNWPSSLTNITYGSSSDDWSASLTPTICNSANFGVGIQAKATANNVDVNVDHVTITIHYSLPTQEGTIVLNLESNTYQVGTILISSNQQLVIQENIVPIGTSIICGYKQLHAESNISSLVNMLLDAYYISNIAGEIIPTASQLIGVHQQLGVENNIQQSCTQLINAYQQLIAEGNISGNGEIIRIVIFPANPNINLFGSFMQGSL